MEVTVKLDEPAEVQLMDGAALIKGKVESIARGITDQDNRNGPELLASVNPTFTWVRLAQRIPVRICLIDVPAGVLIAAGMTCTVKLRSQIEAAELARDRLRTLLPRLQEAQAAEFLTQWRADFEGLKVERDALAAQLREVYPPYATKIADLFARIAVNDEALSRLHQARPAGVALHLVGAELVARGLDGFTRFEPSIASELKLPDRNQAAKLAWPPPTPSIAVQVAADMARMLPPHAGANWHQKRETREAAEARKRKQGSR